MSDEDDHMSNGEKPSRKGFLRCFHTLLYSIQGLKAAWKYEESFRQELLLFLISIPLAFYLAENVFEVILLIFSVLLIIIVELVNSAIEATVDRISLEKHELSGRAKDFGSAAVMLSILAAIAVWTGILLN